MVSKNICIWSAFRAAFGITVLVILLAGGAGALSNDGGGSWQYYRNVTITNTGDVLADYQVMLNLTGGDFPTSANISGADIRFTDEGGAELSYWIEEWDNANRSGRVWVNVTSIPYGVSTMRMWYGNPGATIASNIRTTFILGDDFEYDDAISNHGWTVVTDGLSTATTSTDYASSGTRSFKANAVATITGGNSYIKITNYTFGNSIAEGMFRDITGQSGNEQQVFGFDDGVIAEIVGVGETTDATHYVYRHNMTFYGTSVSRTDDWHKFKIQYDGSVYKLYIEGTNVYTSPAGEGSPKDIFAGNFWGITNLFYWDDIRVRKYASTEPSISVGAETPNTPENFTFVHLTDVHIGYFPKAVPVENNNATYMNYSVNNFTDTLQTIKRVSPDFILITGDLVEYDKKDFFMAFKNLLKGISIPVKGITPGNHDRRDRYSGLIGNNLSDYNKYIKPISNPASIDNNYSFDFKGYRFIGLDSGADYNVSIYDGIIMENKTTSISLSYDPSPESNGLSNEQMTRLRGEFNNTAPKIVFMHHPVMDYTNDNYPGWPGRPVLPDGAPGGNNGAIAFNRWDFINYTRESNVQLVLTGHSHYDAVFNLSGKQVKNSSSNRPLFIQTRSATKDENIRKGFRIVEIKDGKANPYNSVPTPRYNRITISVQFPSSVWYALNVYDSNGRHTGMNANCSDIELGIPNSYYTGDYGGFTSTPQVIVSYSGLKKLNVSNCLLRTSSGSSLQNTSFNLTLEYQTETSLVKVNFNNVTARSLEATDISKP